MPRYTRREFSDLCGIEPKALAVYVGRNKVILNENGEVDTAVAMNMAFLEKKTGKKEIESPVVVLAEPQKKSRIKTTPTPKEPVIQRKEKPIRNKHYKTNDEVENLTTNFEMDNALKRLDMEKKELEVEKLKIQNAKLNGEVIPTELVKMIFAQHFKSVTTAFHQGADNFITEITKRLDLKRDEMVKLRKELVEIINQAVNDSIEDSKGSIDNIQEEYSQTRGVGERK